MTHEQDYIKTFNLRAVANEAVRLLAESYNMAKLPLEEETKSPIINTVYKPIMKEWLLEVEKLFQTIEKPFNKNEEI
jgi:hypothetical protein